MAMATAWLIRRPTQILTDTSAEGDDSESGAKVSEYLRDRRRLLRERVEHPGVYVMRMLIRPTKAVKKNHWRAALVLARSWNI